MVEELRPEWTPKASLKPTKYRMPDLWERLKMDPQTAEILGVDLEKQPYSDYKQQVEWEHKITEAITEIQRS